MKEILNNRPLIDRVNFKLLQMNGFHNGTELEGNTWFSYYQSSCCGAYPSLISVDWSWKCHSLELVKLQLLIEKIVLFHFLFNNKRWSGHVDKDEQRMRLFQSGSSHPVARIQKRSWWWRQQEFKDMRLLCPRRSLSMRPKSPLPLRPVRTWATMRSE